MTKTFTALKSKNRVCHGKTYEFQPDMVNGVARYNAEVSKDKIVLFGVDYNGKQYRNEFKIGDEAEYDSWNLIYTGKITKITEKCVTIEKYGRVYRLNLYQFAMKNWNFDAAKVADHNHNEMMYI